MFILFLLFSLSRFIGDNLGKELTARHLKSSRSLGRQSSDPPGISRITRTSRHIFKHLPFRSFVLVLGSELVTFRFQAVNSSSALGRRCSASVPWQTVMQGGEDIPSVILTGP